LRKQVIGALCIALLAGCSTASVETETPANGTADETAVRTAVNEEAAAVSYEDVMKAAEQIGSAVAEGRWEEAAAAFSASAEGTRDAQGLKELWDAAEHEGPYQVLEADPLFHNGHIGCTVLIQTADGTVMEVLARMNEELRIEKMKFAERPAIAEAESAETWTETVIYAGNAPKISGILTLPVNEETDEKTEAEEEPVLPPVAVLLGDGRSDE